MSNQETNTIPTSATKTEPAKPATEPTSLARQPEPEAPKSTAPATLSQKFGITLDSRGNLDLPSLGFVLQSSGFFPDVQRASQGMVKVMLGRELGFAPVTSVIGIHILRDNNNGRVSVMVGSHLKAGKIKKSGTYDYKVKELTNEKCTLIPRVLEDGTWKEEAPCTFTIQDAQTAKLGGWGKDGQKYKRGIPPSSLFANMNWTAPPKADRQN